MIFKNQKKNKRDKLLSILLIAVMLVINLGTSFHHHQTKCNKIEDKSCYQNHTKTTEADINFYSVVNLISHPKKQILNCQICQFINNLQNYFIYLYNNFQTKPTKLHQIISIIEKEIKSDVIVFSSRAPPFAL
jgi:hypothetical protein